MKPLVAQQDPVSVYPCGYGRSGARIVHLMETNHHLHLIDTRFSPRSRMAFWQGAQLRTRYGWRYHFAGKYLGNIHYKDGGPITLADPEVGIAGLVRYVQEGVSFILLCGCADYNQCHLHVIVELLQQALPEGQIVLSAQRQQEVQR